MIRFSFENKVAIVTGAGQGIGFEISRQLCALGGSVILNDIDENLAVQAAESIKKEKGRCVAAPGDSADLEFIQSIVDAAVSEFGKLDIAIANSGITLFGDFLDYPAESFYRVMNVNLGGSFFLPRKRRSR